MKDKILIVSAGLLPIANFTLNAVSPKSERPNIVFFMAEDLSKNCLTMYNGHGAETPFLNKLASHGIIFNNAYCNAPVSSAARSSVITGCYAPSYGLSSHRKLKEVALPENMWLFPHYLKDAGYYTTNASKTDYNCKMDIDAWDSVKERIDAWRRRKEPGQPFFHCFTIDACHESCLHFQESDMDSVITEHSPDNVRLYPFHPDTKLFRYTYARLFDKIKSVDKVLEKLFTLLEDDGLIDNTFIFYLGDNGGSVPFSKGYTNEAGLNVPLVVYVPENWKEYVPYDYGERADGFVCFMDLAPTVLRLAGVKVPDFIDGRPFLGNGITKDDVESRDVVYGYGDRYDELYAINRTVRKGNFKYSRNYLPYQPKSLYCAYRYNQAAFREWKMLYDEGKLNEIQSLFFQPQGAEELYDLSADPFETVNLASKSEYSCKLKKMRKILKKNLYEEMDLVLIPEAIWIEHVDDIVSFRKDIQKNYRKYYDVASLPIKSPSAIKQKSLKSENPIIRYWAITSCCYFRDKALEYKKEIADLLDDDFSFIRSKAAIYCIQEGIDISEDIFKNILRGAENPAATLMILNDIAYLYETLDNFDSSVSESDLKFFPAGYKERLTFFKNETEL